MNRTHITTQQLADKLGIKPGTLRAAVCREKSYYGLTPVKAKNRFLLWPADGAEQLIKYHRGGVGSRSTD